MEDEDEEDAHLLEAVEGLFLEKQRFKKEKGRKID